MNTKKVLLGAGLSFAIAFAMLAVAQLAWAATIVHCSPSPPSEARCEGTNKNDVIYGTNVYDYIRAWDGPDTVYGRDGDDDLNGGEGPDTVYGGFGDDSIHNGESDLPFGRDENHGGPGNDEIGGHISAEKHFGGRGDDYISDHQSVKNPDVFRCGPGRDEIYYNKGIDKVANDCEVLTPAR